jgi:hypothetical protein
MGVGKNYICLFIHRQCFKIKDSDQNWKYRNKEKSLLIADTMIQYSTTNKQLANHLSQRLKQHICYVTNFNIKLIISLH